MIYDAPMGVNNLPSIPVKKKSGKYTAITKSVPMTMGLRTSEEALKITTRELIRSASFLRKFSFKRLKTFSTSTMASSTRAPIATAIPPRVMVLMETSKREKTRMVSAIDKGMAVKVMKVILQFIKKMKRIIMTMMPPSRTASMTLSMARSIKIDCLNKSLLISRSLSKRAERFSSRFSTSSVNWTVS